MKQMCVDTVMSDIARETGQDIWGFDLFKYFKSFDLFCF